MTNRLFPLSQKYIDFINCVHNVTADFLEGTTASGKTTVGAGIKFMYMVSASPKKLHIIASKTTGTAEKNIIQQDNGILDLHTNKRLSGCIYNFIPAFKKTQIIDRIHLQAAWLASNEFLVVNTCKNYIAEMNIYSWQENKYAPEDGHDHCINACQYAWLPYKNMIGSVNFEA